jgi:hypothetical protein
MAVMPPLIVQVIEAEPKSVSIKVHRLEISEPGPVLLDGQEVKGITGINLEWDIEDRVWRAELRMILRP